MTDLAGCWRSLRAGDFTALPLPVSLPLAGLLIALAANETVLGGPATAIILIAVGAFTLAAIGRDRGGSRR